MVAVSCGIDLGTSGVKVCLMTTAGDILDSTTVTYDIATPQPDRAEIDPGVWSVALAHAIKALLGRQPDAEVVAVGIDGQMHGLVLARGDKAVRPAMLWPDSRASEQVAQWKALDDDLRAPLSNPIVPGMAGPMLGWLAAHEPESLTAADRLLSPKDWVRQQLTSGPALTDPSDASATLLWNPTAGDWHVDLMQALGLPSSLLADVRPSASIAGVVTDAASIFFGIPAGTRVAVGCADSASGLLAAGPAADEALIIVGTGIQVLQPGISASPDAHPRYHTFVAADGRPFGQIAPQNGGLALGRVAELLHADWAEMYDSLDTPAGDTLFAPWLASERLPRPKPAGQGGWLNVGLDTTRPQLLRAALEAVAFQARQALLALPGRPTRVRLVGGGTRDPRMQQLLANALGVATVRCDADDTTAVGAAMLGLATLNDGAPPPSPVGVKDPREPHEDDGLLTRYERFAALSDHIEQLIT